MSYVDVVWTQGDLISESKLDSMIANDRDPEALYQGVEFTERASPSTPGANKVHLYGKDKSGVATLYVINDAGTDYEISENRPAFVFTVTGTLVTGASVTPILIAPRALTIVKAYANVKTAPTGANLVLDINKNASTLWSTQANRLTILAEATSGTQTSFNVTSLVEGDVLTLDTDQVGSSVAGDSLTVTLRCK